MPLPFKTIFKDLLGAVLIFGSTGTLMVQVLNGTAKFDKWYVLFHTLFLGVGFLMVNGRAMEALKVVVGVFKRDSGTS
jgi:hypothetical protein